MCHCKTRNSTSQEDLLVNSDMILVPTLYIGLRLKMRFKSFLDNGGNCFPYLYKALPRFITTKNALCKLKLETDVLRLCQRIKEIQNLRTQ